MLVSFFKAIGQISDPDFRRVMAASLIYTISIFTFLLILTWWLIRSYQTFDIESLEWAIDIFSGGGSLIIALILFPGAVICVGSLLLEKIALAVERKHYPSLPPPRLQSVFKTALVGLRYTGISVSLNIIFFPLFFIPIINLFVFIGLNGYLLGREYFELIALRRLDLSAATIMWRQHRIRLFITGMIITTLHAIPLINCLMPVVAVAFMLHNFEIISKNDGVVSSKNLPSGAIE